MRVTGWGCTDTMPEVEITFTAAENPDTVLATASAPVDANGDWSTFLQIPEVTDGAGYLITPSCLDGDTLAPQVLFVYASEGFIGARPDCPPACG